MNIHFIFLGMLFFVVCVYAIVKLTKFFSRNVNIDNLSIALSLNGLTKGKCNLWEICLQKSEL